jgi:hypothetical protein
MNHMPIGHAAIDRGILAHRRDDDAVGQRQFADGKGFEQFGAAHHCLQTGASRRLQALGLIAQAGEPANIGAAGAEIC